MERVPPHCDPLRPHRQQRRNRPVERPRRRPTAAPGAPLRERGAHSRGIAADRVVVSDTCGGARSDTAQRGVAIGWAGLPQPRLARRARPRRPRDGRHRPERDRRTRVGRQPRRRRGRRRPRSSSSATGNSATTTARTTTSARSRATSCGRPSGSGHSTTNHARYRTHPRHLHRLRLDLGVRAEAAGDADAVYSTCHYNNRDPWAFLSQLATATDSVRLGPGVANPYETHPVTLASRVATLDELSEGRAVFGLGLGDPLDAPEPRARRRARAPPVLEAFKTAQKLWAGERVDHEGTFDAAGAGLNYEPRRAPTFRSTSAARARTCAGWPRNTPTGCCSTARIRRTSRGLASRPTTGLPIDLTIAALRSDRLRRGLGRRRRGGGPRSRPPAGRVHRRGRAPPVLKRHGIDPAAASGSATASRPASSPRPSSA